MWLVGMESISCFLNRNNLCNHNNFMNHQFPLKSQLIITGKIEFFYMVMRRWWLKMCGQLERRLELNLMGIKLICLMSCLIRGVGVVERVRSGREIRRKRESRGSREGHGEGVKSVGGS